MEDMLFDDLGSGADELLFDDLSEPPNDLGAPKDRPVSEPLAAMLVNY